MIDVNGNVVWGPENLIPNSANLSGGNWTAANDATIVGNVVNFFSGVSGLSVSFAINITGRFYYSVQFSPADSGKLVHLYLSDGTPILPDKAIDSTGLVSWVIDTVPAIYLASVMNQVSGAPQSLTFSNKMAKATANYEILTIPPGGTSSKTFTMSVWLAGSGTVYLKNTHGGVIDNYSPSITLTPLPVRYIFTVTNGAGGNGYQLIGVNLQSATEFNHWGMQLEQGSFISAIQ
jgi:hypothetical protein